MCVYSRLLGERKANAERARRRRPPPLSGARLLIGARSLKKVTCEELMAERQCVFKVSGGGGRDAFQLIITGGV